MRCSAVRCCITCDNRVLHCSVPRPALLCCAVQRHAILCHSCIVPHPAPARNAPRRAALPADNPPFKHDHVLKNNSNSLEDWGGDVADIKHALRQIGTDNHVLIIDANLLMYPTYNLQRLVEHCYTRAKNTIAYTTMTQTDMRLFGMDPQTVITLGGNKNGMLVPPIDTIELDAQARACQRALCIVAALKLFLSPAAFVMEQWAQS